MKFSCDKDKLMEVINIVQKSISPKSSNQILECIKLDTTGKGEITFTGTDMELYIEYPLICDVTEGGGILLVSKMFGEIIRRLPQGPVSITVNPSNNITKLKSGSSEFNIQGMAAGDYPNVPVLDEEFRFKITQPELKNLIKKTISFVSVAVSRRPVLTGSLFEIRNNTLNVVASDGHRLALVKQELKENTEDFKFIVPGNTLRELLKILNDDENAEIDVILSDRYVLFDLHEYQVYTRLLDGEFLKYDAILSAKNNIIAEVEKRDITNSLERAILLINDDISAKSENKVPVRFTIGGSKIDINCITGKGQVSDTIAADIEGGELLIGFNCRFLLDAFAACDESRVKIELSTPTSGCFIRDASGNNSYIYMILPVRLYN